MKERAISTDNILEIKTDRERLIELSKFKKQIGKSIKEDENSILKMKIQFSLLLYKSLKNSNFFFSIFLLNLSLKILSTESLVIFVIVA